MPTVSRYGQRQVATAPYPAVRKTAAETELSTGAGLEEARARTGAAVAGLGQTVGRAVESTASIVLQMREEAQQQADELVTLSASNALDAWENKRVYDPETGALTQKGRNALGLPEELATEYEQVTSEIGRTLTTDKQRLAFERLKAQHGQNLDITIRRHVFTEMQTLRGQEFEAFVASKQNAAILNATDPRRVEQELSSAVAVIQRDGPQMGAGPEQVAAQVAKVKSDTYVGVINQLLAQDQTAAARAYFEEAKANNLIAGVDLARVENAVHAGTLKGQAQAEADKILAAGGTLTEQLAKAKALEPELRDATEQRLEHAAAVQKREEDLAAEGELRNAYNIVERTHDVASIPPAIFGNLDGPARSGLRSYAEHLAKGTEPTNDDELYYGLIEQAGLKPNEFADAVLWRYRGQLDDTHFNRLEELQLSMRTGNRTAAEKAINGFRTKKQILDDSLVNYGIDPNAKAGTAESKAIAQLNRMLDIRLSLIKEPTNEDVQHTIDALLSQPVTVPGSIWNIWPGGKPFFESSKRLIDLEIGDVPATERAQIEQALKRAGRPISDATVLDLYLELKARGR